MKNQGTFYPDTYGEPISKLGRLILYSEVLSELMTLLTLLGCNVANKHYVSYERMIKWQNQGRNT